MWLGLRLRLWLSATSWLVFQGLTPAKPWKFEGYIHIFLTDVPSTVACSNGYDFPFTLKRIQRLCTGKVPSSILGATKLPFLIGCSYNIQDCSLITA
jgi:hypothetical protein